MPPPHARRTRRELIAVAALTVLGAMLRLAGPGRLGLEHFDEGIYALSGLWSLKPDGLAGLDPMVIPYAPPGLPILIGVSFTVFDVTTFGAIAPALAAGIATIAAIGWLGRRTFGTGAGAAASALAALAGVHVAFSRMALTDAPFLLAWLVALGLGGRFLEKPTWGRAASLGLAVGLAQNFKYNGWLAGIVVAGAAVLGVLLEPSARSRRALVRTFGLGLAAATVAALMYLPWYLFVENHGGYAGLVRHHSGYLKGADAWLSNLRLQLGQGVALSGGPPWTISSWMASVAGVLAVGGLRGRARGVEPRWAGFAVAVGLAGAAYALAPGLPWWVGVAGLPVWLRDPRPAVRLQGVALLGLSILTPFYHPYARLWLPLHAAGWVLLGGTMAELARGAREGGFDRRWGAVLAAGCLLALAATALDRPAARPYGGALGPYPDNSTELGLLRPGRLLPKGLSSDGPLVVHARPTLLFGALRLWQGPVRRAASSEQVLEAVRSGSFGLLDEAVLQPADLADGPLAGWFGPPLSSLARTPGVHAWEEPVGAVTALDLDPGLARSGDEPRVVRIILLAPGAAIDRTPPPPSGPDP